MRIIHIAGLSGFGKTTFIRELIPRLEQKGPVAVIKHLGHHEYSLGEGKDTTQYFLAGASISIGIDEGKSVWTVREPDLDRVLQMLGDIGTAFAVIEGFKSRSFPKIVIGDLGQVDQVLMVNPNVDEVIAHLERFSCYTKTGTPIRTSLDPFREAPEGVILTIQGTIQELTGNSLHLPQDAGLLAGAIQSEISSLNGLLGVVMTPGSGIIRSGQEIASLSIHAAHPNEALIAMRKAGKIIREKTRASCDQAHGALP